MLDDHHDYPTADNQNTLPPSLPPSLPSSLSPSYVPLSFLRTRWENEVLGLRAIGRILLLVDGIHHVLGVRIHACGGVRVMRGLCDRRPKEARLALTRKVQPPFKGQPLV